MVSRYPQKNTQSHHHCSQRLDGKDQEELEALLKYVSRIIQHGEALDYHNHVLKNKLSSTSQTIESLKKQLANQQKKMSVLSLLDPLTNILNNQAFKNAVAKRVAEAKRHNEYLSLLTIAIPHYKEINVAYGQRVGNQLLKQFTERIHSRIRQEDEIGRISENEFCVLLVNTHSAYDAGTIAEKILTSVRMPFSTGKYRIQIGANIGIAVFPIAAQRIDKLFRCSSGALEQAKKSGENQFKFYSESINKKYAERMETLQALRHAKKEEHFYLVYQPQFDLIHHRLVGLEALIRWQDPVYGIRYPETFISLAEDSGLITYIDDWVLKEACKQYALWRSSGYLSNKEKISVNISPQQLTQNHFIQSISNILEANKLQPENLELELTETSLLEQDELSLHIMTKLNHLGIDIAIDDFGTGYSSLKRLQQFPISTLKIDRCFIKDIDCEAHHKIILNSILQLGADLDLKIVAEGVENIEQLLFLKEKGCGFAQGFYFSKPLNQQEVEELLRK